MTAPTWHSVVRSVMPGRVASWLKVGWDRMRGLSKQDGELDYWLGRREIEGQALGNGHYKTMMLAMAGQQTPSFCRGQVVADFGCGPRGSLTWADEADRRIGIDVLAGEYAREFDLSSHGMEYVESNETSIPLPDACVDWMFTMNSLDHVDEIEVMIDEILRVIRPGGWLVGSFNLNEWPTICEPQRLTLEGIERNLLSRLVEVHRTLHPKGPGNDAYAAFFGRDAPPNDPQILWARGMKP